MPSQQWKNTWYIYLSSAISILQVKGHTWLKKVISFWISSLQLKQQIKLSCICYNIIK